MEALPSATPDTLTALQTRLGVPPRRAEVRKGVHVECVNVGSNVLVCLACCRLMGTGADCMHARSRARPCVVRAVGGVAEQHGAVQLAASGMFPGQTSVGTKLVVVKSCTSFCARWILRAFQMSLECASIAVALNLKHFLE